MTRFIDALPGGLQQFVGDILGIAAAICFPLLPNGFGESEGVGHLLVEYRMQKFNHQRQRRFVIVVKDDFAVADIGPNITHGTCP